ncbi:hypothetical protein ACYRFS_02155 [Listeria kieliensis]|uniref:DUF3196 domain-containing protein n=1 Tax=Listeria kieliensis TaxID=1621700 RepID=A0A3D8TVC4_9LIST|nr:hypothetical protein [Listeria kieliensis]RDX02607.1 hypothetical protein UR08_03625 [Listeria kieliensis]
MTDQGKHFPTNILNWLEGKHQILNQQEQVGALSFLEKQYELDPCDVLITKGLVRLYTEMTEYELAKHTGRSFLTMNGYNKEILTELALAYMNTDEMDTYFSLVRYFTEEEEVSEDVGSSKSDHNVIPFPKKLVTRSQKENWVNLPVAEQLEFLQKIRFESVSPFLESFRAILEDKSASPFVQSIVFELLQEQEVNQLFKVCKLGMESEFNPIDVSLLGEDAFINVILDLLKERLESENPTLLEQLLQTVQHHAFMLYPFTFQPREASLWKDAYLLFASELYGAFLEIEPTPELEEALSFIQNLEEHQQNYLL